jgi:beta-glucanase (GH16 family)
MRFTPLARRRLAAVLASATALSCALSGSSPVLARSLDHSSSRAHHGSPTHGPNLAAAAGHRPHSGQGSLRVTWSDDFTGPAGAPPNPANWQAVTGGNGWGNNELEYYTARRTNVSLDGSGHLAITARTETYAGNGYTRRYTSARLQTLGRFQTAYGRIEARIKVPAGRGLWPAFWALGPGIDTIGWPYCGEFDVMENIGSDPFTAFGSIHGPQPGAKDNEYGLSNTVHSPTSLASSFHVYGVDWSPNRLAFSLDGVVYAVETPASLAPGQQWVFNHPFFLLLNLAVGGTWPGSPNTHTRFPATMLVDWVRVYS